jgi:signal transduction histidine kinase
VAREIHDQLGQILTSLSMDLTWLEGRLPKDESASDGALIETIQSMANTIDAAVRLVREIASELRPGVLDDIGLIAAIEWQAEKFQKKTGVECHLALQHNGLRLDRHGSTELFRIFQEILTNVARHASATEVDISLTDGTGDLMLEVRDNGRGITDAEVSDSMALGILGMRERAMALRGDFHIVGSPGKGTRVAVRMPRHA